MSTPGQTRGASPHGHLEQAIARIWCDVLEVEGLDRDTNFFAEGGGSLHALRAVRHMNTLVRTEIPADLVFTAPTVAEAARRIAELWSHEREEEPDRRAPVIRSATPSERAEQRGCENQPGKASPTQERIWFFEVWQPGTPCYHMPWAVDIHGELDADAVDRAVATLINRHEALRTVFRDHEGLPVPHTLAHLDVAPRRHRVSDATRAARHERAEHLLRELATRPFTLDGGPLVRVDLVTLSDTEHVLLLTVHHLVCDGESITILLDELAACYRAEVTGERPGLPPVAGFAEAAGHQERLLADGGRGRALAHWRDRLAKAPRYLDIPCDLPRPAVFDPAGATHHFHFDSELLSTVRAFARERGTTMFAVLASAFQALLHQWAGVDDIVIGVTAANRPLPELRSAVGPLFNTLPVRSRLTGRTDFNEAASATHEEIAAGLAHQALPFDEVVAHTIAEREPGRSPLAQVLFEFDTIVGQRTPVSGQTWSQRLVDTGTAKFDLTVTITDDGNTLSGAVNHSTGVLLPETGKWLADSYIALLRMLCIAPDQDLRSLDLPEAPRIDVTDRAVGPVAPYPDSACVHEFFEQQVDRVPEATAVRCGSVRLSYAGLEARANRLAHHLRAAGVTPESAVGVCLRRSERTLVALLAVLKAGGAYVPIDPDYPDERKRYMTRQVHARVLVTEGEQVPEWFEGTVLDTALAETDRTPAHRPPRTATSANPAYVIYTSGSTGLPKAVVVEHRSLVNYLTWAVREYVGEGAGGAPVFSSFTFDMIVPNLYAPLLTGQPVCVVPDATPTERLAEAILERAPYAFIKLTPGQLDLLAEFMTPDQARDLCEALVVGADTFPSRVLHKWREMDPFTPVLNEYGPTEASVGNCVHHVLRMEGGASLPIGLPIPNTTMYVLDERMTPVGLGKLGELYIGGDCVVRGYAGQPGTTAERFVPDPFGRPGARLYRTGDLGRWRPDGSLEFCGRADDQVKIDGYRVEPGEIEAAIARHPRVRDSVVAVAGPSDHRRLLGYYAADPDVASDDVLAHLRSELPAYLLPAVLTRIDQVPLNSNGKVDRKALPPPGQTGRPGTAASAPPREPVRKAVTRLMAETLGIHPDEVGEEDQFFTLGGRSLDIVRLSGRIKRLFRTEISITELMREPSAVGISEAVIRNEAKTGDSAERAIEYPGPGSASPEEHAGAQRSTAP